MRRFLRAAMAFGAGILLFVATAGVPKDAAAATGNDTGGQGIVYLIRGGLNIFSTGMDEIADKLRAKDIDARTLGQAWWHEKAAEAIERYEVKPGPVVLVGHSFGANAAVLFAEELGKHDVPVALVLLLDPTEALKAPWNVRRLINYLSIDSTAMDFNVWTNAGHPGEVENILHREVNHLSIDNNVKLQDEIIAEIRKVLGSSARASAQ